MLINTDSFTLCDWLAVIGVQGCRPPSFTPFLAGADLFGIPTSRPKPRTISLRHIAISLCIRRIIGDALLQLIVSSRLCFFFEPLQFGIAVKHGAETHSRLAVKAETEMKKRASSLGRTTPPTPSNAAAAMPFAPSCNFTFLSSFPSSTFATRVRDFPHLERRSSGLVLDSFG